MFGGDIVKSVITKKLRASGLACPALVYLVIFKSLNIAIGSKKGLKLNFSFLRCHIFFNNKIKVKQARVAQLVACWLVDPAIQVQTMLEANYYCQILSIHSACVAVLT